MKRRVWAISNVQLRNSGWFQFVGFMLTYLLHTTHAAKLGSRAGFGITLIQYGFAMRRDSQEAGFGQTTQETWNRPQFATPEEAAEYYRNLNGTVPTTTEPTNADGSNPFFLGDTAAEWISFLLMTIGTYPFQCRYSLRA